MRFFQVPELPRETQVAQESKCLNVFKVPKFLMCPSRAQVPSDAQSFLSAQVTLMSPSNI